jgi:hypothetical protein
MHPRLVGIGSGIGWYGFGFGLSLWSVFGVFSRLLGNHCS